MPRATIADISAVISAIPPISQNDGLLASLYPAVTVLLAAGVLGERLGAAQRTGIGICTLAVATLAVG